MEENAEMKSASEDMWDAWLHEQTSDLFVAAIAYFLSLLIVVFAVSLAQCIVQDETLQMPSANGDLVAALCSWDGYWYISVASQGYTYNPDAVSNIAFFPVFPLLGRVLASLFGVDVPTSLLVASNSCCLAFFWLLVKYCRLRQLSRTATILAVFLVAVFPTGFFFAHGLF
jgi:positive regulator of sigma E activity